MEIRKGKVDVEKQLPSGESWAFNPQAAGVEE